VVYYENLRRVTFSQQTADRSSVLCSETGDSKHEVYRIYPIHSLIRMSTFSTGSVTSSTLPAHHKHSVKTPLPSGSAGKHVVYESSTTP